MLTARRISDDSLVGKQFVNQKIVDGAVVTIGSLTMGKVSGTNQTAALQQLLESITVVTKDGEWTADEKKQHRYQSRQAKQSRRVSHYNKRQRRRRNGII